MQNCEKQNLKILYLYHIKWYVSKDFKDKVSCTSTHFFRCKKLFTMRPLI